MAAFRGKKMVYLIGYHTSDHFFIPWEHSKATSSDLVLHSKNQKNSWKLLLIPQLEMLSADADHPNYWLLVWQV